MIDYSKIILTGATGWLGSRLALALTRGIKELGAIGSGGKQIKCLVKSGDNFDDLVDLGADIIVGDITNLDDCRALLKDEEGCLLIHTAGIIHPKLFTSDFSRINVYGTKNLLNAAATFKASRFLVISSNSPIGCNPSPEHLFTERSPFNPYMKYGKSKQVMETFLQGAINSKGYPEISIIRPPWFYGPGQPPRQTDFFRMIRDGKFPLMGDGLNKRSMGFIDNLVLGILLAAYSKKAAGEIYWIADERPYTMLEIVETVKNVMRNEFKIEVKENNLHVPSFISDFARIADMLTQSAGLYNQKIHVLSEMNQTISCDISKAKSELGFQPICSIDEGMRRSIDWCLKNNQEF
ncbi:3-isopropylmalate--2-methylmalate dehydratase large subunit protein [Candidatus Micropelagos thuwalensis]|uniref:3-isopropylmalate--2-methylmalate dehydratase large subunit protein n=1 Tax=Candidatus Micropelagius thuwalensis TaxID=1397666 RepID=U2XLQ0_9PROT|nr:NAD(P)-dependent oxidoreductase [Candidatus Micropelagos thuwalensis]ERL46057.1 3-isopropylmalate--2-methylmalate dehydratase large subunit protein [Candidatus Micropelagos thuwalensis]